MFLLIVTEAGGLEYRIISSKSWYAGKFDANDCGDACETGENVSLRVRGTMLWEHRPGIDYDSRDFWLSAHSNPFDMRISETGDKRWRGVVSPIRYFSLAGFPRGLRESTRRVDLRKGFKQAWGATLCEHLSNPAAAFLETEFSGGFTGVKLFS